MKSEIGIRPNYHQKERRCDGHIYINLYAYHIIHTVRTLLKDKGIRYRWDTIRLLMSSHENGTMSVRTKGDKTIYRRKCMGAELHHKDIYDAFGLGYVPCKPKKCKM